MNYFDQNNAPLVNYLLQTNIFSWIRSKWMQENMTLMLPASSRGSRKKAFTSFTVTIKIFNMTKGRRNSTMSKNTCSVSVCQHLRRGKVLQSQRTDCLNLGLIRYSFHLKPGCVCGKADECFGIKKEPIMGSRSCPTVGAKAGLRCEARRAIPSEMNFPPELCGVSAGSDSSASDNHTCQREAALKACVLLCVYIRVVL